MEIAEFTYEEVRAIESWFNSTCWRLDQSGDYPEKARDKIIKGKLLDWLYHAPDDISLARRMPKE